MPVDFWQGIQPIPVNLYDIPESSTDSWGQPSQAEVTIATGLLMKVRPLRGDEMLNVRQIWPTATHYVECGWLGSGTAQSVIPITSDNPQGLVMPQMVIQLQTDMSWLHILFAENVDKANRKWLLTCEEKIGATS